MKGYFPIGNPIMPACLIKTLSESSISSPAMPSGMPAHPPSGKSASHLHTTAHEATTAGGKQHACYTPASPCVAWRSLSPAAAAAPPQPTGGRGLTHALLSPAPQLSNAQSLSAHLSAPQLSNAQALSAYLFGSASGARSLPIVRGFEAGVVGESAARLQAIVGEHAGWLAANCSRQAASYRRALISLEHCYVRSPMNCARKPFSSRRCMACGIPAGYPA